MFTEQYEQWFKAMNKPQAMSEWTKLGTDIFQRSAAQQWRMVEENVTRITDQTKRFASVRKPEDFFNLQKECINENLTASINCVQTMMKSAMENVDAITKLCSQSQSQNQASNQSQQHNNKAGDKK